MLGEKEKVVTQKDFGHKRGREFWTIQTKDMRKVVEVQKLLDVLNEKLHIDRIQ